MDRHVTVLLPIGKLFDQVMAEALMPAATEAKVSLIRVDSEFPTESRLGTVCNEIEKADLVIADLTGRNPNVMYQVGYAHGIGKKVLLIAQHGENFPFDRSRHDFIPYAGDHEFLKDEVVAFLRDGQMRAGSKEPGKAESNKEAKEKFMALFGDILAAHGQEHRGEIVMENAKTFILLDQDLELALVQELARRARELGIRLKLM